MVAAAEEDPLLGRTLLGKLRVVRRIGAGGMGAVYEVEHKVTGHRRALKVLHPGMADGEVLARFAREARVSALVRSTHMVETFDAGATEDGMAYVLMELLEGRPVTRLIADSGRMAPEVAVEIFSQVCEGVAAAHEVGIVHRDLKPDNLFLVRGQGGQEQVKILDFGISKFTAKQAAFEGTLTGEGSLLGTPYYMSPEQMRAERDVDHRADVYAIGVMLYEALAGRRPFDATTFTALVVKIHEGQCEPLASLVPGLDPTLVATVERAMHKDREQRFPSVRELAAALRASRRRGSSEDRPSWADSGRMIHTLGGGRETGSRTLPPARSRGWWLAVGGVIVVGGALTLALPALWAGGLTVAHDPPPPTAPPRLVNAPPTTPAPGLAAPPPGPPAVDDPARTEIPVGADLPLVVQAGAPPTDVALDAGARPSRRVRAGAGSAARDPSAPSRPREVRPRPGGQAVDRDDPYDD
ncbi:MAG: serine/threonine protein kinase [Deltaproteobacteria bacterium]|nr:serine/threonine protein kinase [Deltaproteobacteria bacterium]